MKKIALSLLTALVILGVSQAQTFAQNIGYIDVEKVLGGYDKAQSFLADKKVREADLQKNQADFVKQIEEAKKKDPKNPVASNQLEKDLNARFTKLVEDYRTWLTTQQKGIDTVLETTIKEVAASKGIDVVLLRQVIFFGGTDLTGEVVGKLNAKK